MRKGDINKERKTLLTLCQNRESSLSPKEHPYSLKIKLIPTSSNQSNQGFSFNFVRDQTNGPRLQIKYIQPHIQLGDIKARFKIKLYSPSDRKVLQRSNQRSFIVFFHCKESYKGLYSHTHTHTHTYIYIYINQYKLIICYTIS